MEHLSVGVVERSIIGSTLWCTNLLFSPKGGLLSKHRKLQPTAAERIVWSQGESTNAQGGDNLPVAKTSIGKIGGLICWESKL
jgi:nitrilase